MLNPFSRKPTTPEELAFRFRVIKAHVDRWSLDQLFKGDGPGQITERSLRGPRRGGYDPNQPRVPKGHPDGGQWTDDDGGPVHPLAIALRYAASERPPKRRPTIPWYKFATWRLAADR